MTDKKTEALKLALESLEDGEAGHAAQILREALAQSQNDEEQPAQQQEPKKDLMWSTVAMQERHDQRIQKVVATLGRIKQEQLAEQPAQSQFDHTAAANAALRDAQNKSYQIARAAQQQEPVAWFDGPHLVMREDWRNRSNYKGPYVGAGRAIPDSWVPSLYTSPPNVPPARASQRSVKPWVGLKDAARVLTQSRSDEEQPVSVAEPHKQQSASVSEERGEPVAGVVIREGLPTLLQDRHIKPTDQRLYTFPPAQRKPLTDEQRKAIVVCFTSGKVSVSEVQRKLAINYNEAQKLCQSIVDLGLAQGLQLAPSLNRHGIKGDA